MVGNRPETAIVVIGRNEGARLRNCLVAARKQCRNIIYVDSGSTDDSVEYARSTGVDVLQLDPARPFSAARGRNEGFAWLTGKYPELELIQFIDGDCELCPGWIDFAAVQLTQNPAWVLVAGRTIERYPEKSLYNQLCDLEWQVPTGEAQSCGGIFMIRRQAFEAAGGFNPQVTSGEEPELCYRLRQQGWKIHRLDFPMVLHDAEMTRFSQWWKRTVRSGHSYAQGYAMHGAGNERYCLRDSLRIWVWALLLPVMMLALAIITGSPWWLLLALAYPLQIFRTMTSINQRLNNRRLALLYAAFNMAGKWPQLLGQLTFILKKIGQKPITIIEYK
ncbi:glycosyltransferase family 2 protein [Desulfurivibrio sp. D14AmB]|uniref:glycosyltransferase family 2 protein n=1 Tax=Desulfurivibrio sp. D14AmB TaxID=3374370 RepID=UPI00376EC6EC